jgi:hypothetical protein
MLRTILYHQILYSHLLPLGISSCDSSLVLYSQQAYDDASFCPLCSHTGMVALPNPIFTRAAPPLLTLGPGQAQVCSGLFTLCFLWRGASKEVLLLLQSNKAKNRCIVCEIQLLTRFWHVFGTLWTL